MSVNYYIATGGKEYGPISADKVKELLHANAITTQTPVFKSGLRDWVTVDRLKEFRKTNTPQKSEPKAPGKKAATLTGLCHFTGGGRQYAGPIFIHLFLLNIITCGIYMPWAMVKLFRVKASHTFLSGKSVSFKGKGGQLFSLMFIQYLITLITFGIYSPWAMARFLRWRAENTLVETTPSRFTGEGGALLVFSLVHLMLLPALTLGIYIPMGVYRFYAWKEEHSLYGGERTSFGAGFLSFLKINFANMILNILTLGMYSPRATANFFRWQIKGLRVGNENTIKHFPPVKTGIGTLLIIALIACLVFFGRSQIDDLAKLVKFDNFNFLKHASVKKEPGIQKEPEKAIGSPVSDWRMNLDNIDIPKSPVNGRIHGKDFKPNRAELQNGILTLKQGKGFFPDYAIKIFLFLKKGESPEGKIYHVTEKSGYSNPHVYLSWKLPGTSTPQTKAFLNNYVMQLEFDSLKDGEFSGRIYIAIRDNYKSFASGTFQAQLK